MDRKTYTIMLVRPKSEKGAMYNASTSMRFEYGKRKCLLFTYSLWNGIGQENIHLYACKGNKTTNALYTIDLSPRILNKEKRKRLIFPYSISNGHRQKNIIHYACKAKEWQRRYVQLNYIHAFRIGKKEMSLFSLFAMKRHWTEKHIPVYV